MRWHFLLAKNFWERETRYIFDFIVIEMVTWSRNKEEIPFIRQRILSTFQNTRVQPFQLSVICITSRGE